MKCCKGPEPYTPLGTDSIFAVAARGVVFDVFDNFGGNVTTGDFLDAEAWGGVNFEYQGTVRRSH